MIASTQAFLKGGISQSPQSERRPQGYSPLRPESATVDEPFREPVAKLGKMITDRVPVKLGLHKITKVDPEYWAVARLCTDEEAELAMKFGGIRKPKTFAQLKKLSGRI